MYLSAPTVTNWPGLIAMLWRDLIDQERVVDVLRRAIEGDRVAHAYLFHGPEGVGKTATALAFAQTLLCERGGPDACGRCLACTKVNRLIHPDVHVLFPQPKDTPLEDVADRRQQLAANPYAAVDYVRRPSLEDATKTSNKQVLYHVARVHDELHRPASFRPVEGRYTVAIVTDADLMRVEAANAFLKLLEEPSPRTVFILTTSRVDRILPTIRSRCQQLRFDPLDPAAIERALVERDGLPADRAALLARMADGSYARARDLAVGDDLQEQRELIVRFLRHSYARQVEPLADIIDEVNGLGRERVKSLMSLFQVWLRDLVLYRTLGEEAPLVNVDQQKVIHDFCTNLPRARLDDLIRLVEEARELTERNVNISLLVTALSIKMAAAMHGDEVGGLYIPLSEADVCAA